MQSIQKSYIVDFYKKKTKLITSFFYSKLYIFLNKKKYNKHNTSYFKVRINYFPFLFYLVHLLNFLNNKKIFWFFFIIIKVNKNSFTFYFVTSIYIFISISNKITFLKSIFKSFDALINIPGFGFSKKRIII